MFKQIILPILGVAAFIVVVGLFFQKSSLLNLSGSTTPQTTSAPSKSIIIGSKTVQVQIADTNDKRIKGLSGATSLDANSGMLFVFGQKSSPLFWMKDMLFSLDLIWISNGKVVKIDKNVPKPAPNTQDNKLKTYTAGQPIDFVLEVNGGFSVTNSIKVGDNVDLSGI
jgi:uncharacterized membrane protein (UPF0127 family)